MQLNLFDKTNVNSIKIKLIISVWNNFDDEYISYSESYNIYRDVWFS